MPFDCDEDHKTEDSARDPSGIVPEEGREWISQLGHLAPCSRKQISRAPPFYDRPFGAPIQQSSQKFLRLCVMDQMMRQQTRWFARIGLAQALSCQMLHQQLKGGR